MWIKFRTKFAYGSNKWEYKWINSKKDVKTFLEEISDNYNHSDKFRGCDWKEIKLPPVFILQEKLQATKNHLEELRNRIMKETEKKIKFLSKLLEIKQPKIKPNCKKCGYKFYCKHALNKKIKKDSEECIKQYVLKMKK